MSIYTPVFRAVRLAAALMVACVAATPVVAQAATSDFRVGDRIVLSVAGEKTLTDTFTVAAGPLVDLPTIGKVTLANVRHKDVEAYLAQEIGRYYRNPIVRARTLLRIGVFGGVTKPNFYDFPVDALVSEVLSHAGPQGDGKFDKVRLERDGDVLIKPDSLRKALDHGATLADLGVQSGDRLFSPPSSDAEKRMRVLGYILGIPVAILGIVAIFRPAK